MSSPDSPCPTCGGTRQIRGRPPWHAGFPRVGPPRHDPDVMIACPTCCPWFWCASHRRATREAVMTDCELVGPFDSYGEALALGRAKEVPDE